MLSRFGLHSTQIMEQVNLSTHRPRRTIRQISALLANYKTSGLTVTEFCERHQVHKSNFYKWVSRYQEKSKSKKIQRSAFAKVQVTSSESLLFAEVNGIRIYQAVAASYLKELKG
jgi:transposase